MSKLLIVDNSGEILEMMKFILERHGYTVKILTESGGITKEISEFEPDLLIIDIFLANEDGREICKRLRNEAKTEHLALLAISASHQALEDYKSFCADDVLEKPFDIKILQEKIRSILVRKKALNSMQPI